MSVVSLVTDGPLLLATPVAAAAGLLSFFSPCVLPLVPGYLSYVTGLSGADLEGTPRRSARRSATAKAKISQTQRVTGDAWRLTDLQAGPGTGRSFADPGLVAAAVGAGTGGPASAGVALPVEGAAQVAPVETLTACAATTAGSEPRRWSGAALPRAALRRARRAGRVTVGTGLFVLGFAVPLVTWGVAFGGAGQWLKIHQVGISQLLGAVTILMGLLFAGVFSRFTWANRELRFHWLPSPGLLGAPLLGVLFGLGWTPCLGPTLAAVQGLAFQSATAERGAFLSAVYCLGLGVPFLVVGLAFRQVAGTLAAVRSHARLLTFAGGALLVAVGILQVTGSWMDLVTMLQAHIPGSVETPL